MLLWQRSSRSLLGAVSLAVLILGQAVLLADDPKANTAVKPTERKGTAKRHEGFLEIAKKGKVDVLFLGDSITQGWEGKGKAIWKERYDGINAANFGIGGDRTQHVLWRITEGKELKGIHPKLVVLMIGTNNMGAAQPTKDGGLAESGGNTAPEIAAGVTAIVKEIHKQLPKTKILLLAIFPRGEQPGTPIRKKIDEVNQAIAKLDDKGKTVRYLDINKKFLDSKGVLKPEIMPDYLHLSDAGYKIWAEAIDKPLADLVK